MKRSARSLLFVLVATFLITATGSLMAQTPTDPSMVYFSVTVADRVGRIVTRLPREQFQVFEDNVPQQIAFFSESDTPLSVTILLDVDASAREQAKEMALAGLIRRSSPDDEFLLAEKAESPVNDAVYQALNKLLQRRGDSARALVLYTMSTNAGANSFTKVKELLRDQDVRFYVIGLPARPDLAGDQDRAVLRELAEISGGSSFFPTSIFQVQGIYRTIGGDLRNQYLIGYRSTNGANDGSWRKIKVKAENPDQRNPRDLTIRAKRGYYAPTVAKSSPAKK